MKVDPQLDAAHGVQGRGLRCLNSVTYIKWVDKKFHLVHIAGRGPFDILDPIQNKGGILSFLVGVKMRI